MYNSVSATVSTQSSSSLKTKIGSHLRLTTRECVYVIRRGHFRSHNKDGGHIVRSAIAENPSLHVHFTALSFIELELLPIEVLHRRNRNFGPYFSSELDLDPMTFIYELDPRSTSRLSKLLNTYIHTHTHTPLK